MAGSSGVQDEGLVRVIGTSALLTTTMGAQKELEEELRKAGLKDRFKTMVGGAPNPALGQVLDEQVKPGRYSLVAAISGLRY